MAISPHTPDSEIRRLLDLRDAVVRARIDEAAETLRENVTSVGESMRSAHEAWLDQLRSRAAGPFEPPTGPDAEENSPITTSFGGGDSTQFDEAGRTLIEESQQLAARLLANGQHAREAAEASGVDPYDTLLARRRDTRLRREAYYTGLMQQLSDFRGQMEDVNDASAEASNGSSSEASSSVSHVFSSADLPSDPVSLTSSYAQAPAYVGPHQANASPTSTSDGIQWRPQNWVLEELDDDAECDEPPPPYFAEESPPPYDCAEFLNEEAGYEGGDEDEYYYDYDYADRDRDRVWEREIDVDDQAALLSSSPVLELWIRGEVSRGSDYPPHLAEYLR